MNACVPRSTLLCYKKCMKALAYSVLRALADGEFHSGENLARSAGMSRASVWYAIRELEAAQLTVYKVRGRGYRLAHAISLIDGQAVAAALGAQAGYFSVGVEDAVESTNTALLRRAAAGAAHGTVLATEWQTAGRGRMGRTWQSGIGNGLTFSLLWRFDQGAACLGGLSLAVGMAIVRVLRASGAQEVGLKWPNDVLWRGCKLAGILIEMHGDALGPTAAVIGIGLNVRLSEMVRDRIDQAAGDLETACGHTVDRNTLLAELLLELRGVLTAFSRSGLPPLREEWRHYHLYEGRAVAIRRPDGSIEHGEVRGIAEDGALLLFTRDGLRRYHSGEVSLRAAEAGTRGGPVRISRSAPPAAQ